MALVLLATLRSLLGNHMDHFARRLATKAVNKAGLKQQAPGQIVESLSNGELNGESNTEFKVWLKAYLTSESIVIKMVSQLVG